MLTSSDVATARAASPWDRWPRWSADKAASSSPVAATYHDETTRAEVVAANFRRDEVVRKNSPPRDPGPGPIGPSGRTHIVIDGDSLQRLADRYLDDPARSDEIYQLNRDLLASPDLLPIGVELRIPDRRSADGPASLATSCDIASKPHVGDGMVPVDSRPRDFGGEPAPSCCSRFPRVISNSAATEGDFAAWSRAGPGLPLGW